ncbi:MAG: zf-TFIIB domain-containing protein [Candidatus Hinthialibacter antarcticus]|nr:zf-TFIIB domain-containing protein [Candidatus Hinthialibacter antarcticus]
MCPHCGEAMIVLELEGVEIDFCPSCKGTWLDAGELELLCEPDGAESGAVREQAFSAKRDRKSKRRCPRCNWKMDGVRLGGVELERCCNQHGLWFDRGEMEQVIASFSDQEKELGRVARFFADLYHNEFKPESKGK